MDFFLIDVDTIQCSVPYSEIKEHEDIINRLANIILETGGIINPLFVKKLGFDSYELIHGEIEYYAAVKASEIDPKKGEMIAAFIIEDDPQELIKKQINFLRKSLVNVEDIGQTTCTASDNYSKLNSVHRDINQIHEKLESLMEMNTAKGLRDLLRKQINSIISESDTKSKQEAIQYLKNSQAELRDQQKKINDQILELSKVNLLDTTYDKLSELMQQLGSSTPQTKASWEAIEYWRKSDQELTWDNLKKSTVNKSKDKIRGFADKSYQTLKKVAYL